MMETFMMIGCRFLSSRPRLWVMTVVVSFLLAPACLSQQDGDQDHRTLAETFVTDFYASYHALWRSQLSSGTPAWVNVARDIDSILTTELTRALSTDHEEALKRPREIDGVDFDPFFAAQDPCDTYSVERITTVPTGLHAEVYGDCVDGEEGVPDVIAEVVWVSGGFRFSNFYYPGSSTDLVTVLRRLRDARQ
jgi:hypothetical protein